MVNRKLNLIKGQSERSFEKTKTESTCFTPPPKYRSIDLSSGDGNHKAASEFFANLRKTCRNTELDRE